MLNYGKTFEEVIQKADLEDFKKENNFSAYAKVNGVEYRFTLTKEGDPEQNFVLVYDENDVLQEKFDF